MTGSLPSSDAQSGSGGLSGASNGMGRRATALARAKLNLSLEIEGVRDDGMHLLNSVVCSISLSDRVTLTTRSDESSTLEVLGENVGPDTLNLALKAATLFQESFGGPGFDILLEKVIPVGAGMGGGSADAAAVLVLARHLFAGNVSDAELARIGNGLGADVPFCITGGLARMRGVGEVIERAEIPASLAGASLVLAVPDFWMPTAEVYVAWDKSPKRGRPDRVPAPLVGVVDQFVNDLEPAAETLVPSMRDCRYALTELLGSPARMTGSGSAVFGFLPPEPRRSDVASGLGERFDRFWQCRVEGAGVAIL